MARKRKRKSKSTSRSTSKPGRKTRTSAKAVTARPAKARAKKKARRSTGAANLSIADLQRLVAEREQEVSRLQQRRETLMAEVANIDARIHQQLGGGSAPARRGRPVGSVSTAKVGAKPRKTASSGGMRGQLPELITQVMSANGSPMKLREIASGVLDAGYATKSSKFGVIIGQRIAEMNNVKKIGHGIYALK